MESAPVWWVVLRDFAFNLLAFLKVRREKVSCPEYLDSEWLERFAVIIEACLEAGASPKMEFVLDFGHSNQFYAATLELLLETLKPPNWPTLLPFFQGEARGRDLELQAPKSSADGTSTIHGGSLALRMPSKTCSMSMLLKDSWGVVGIQDDTSNGLFGPFKVRVF
jgi:hypothetical protein